MATTLSIPGVVVPAKLSPENNDIPDGGPPDGGPPDGGPPDGGPPDGGPPDGGPPDGGPPDGGPPDRGSSDGGPPDLLSVTGLLNAERPTYQCERESLNFNSIPLNHTSLVNRCWCRFCKYLPATPEAVKLTETLLGVAEE